MGLSKIPTYVSTLFLFLFPLPPINPFLRSRNALEIFLRKENLVKCRRFLAFKFLFGHIRQAQKEELLPVATDRLHPDWTPLLTIMRRNEITGNPPRLSGTTNLISSVNMAMSNSPSVNGAL
ncbi:MAG: hypothetical protein ACI8UZ_001139 [Akkermansiaceae bacterium]|jgi:hypothetical protein